MRLSASQYVVRLTCGLGLLLMPAVQQKVCAWPVPTDLESPEPVGSPAPPDADEPPKHKPPPLTLAATLPDVMAPRWPSHTHLTAAQRVRPLPAATWSDGPTGVDDQSGPVFGAIFTGKRSRLPASQVLPALDAGGPRTHGADRHVFRTSILRTGPPRA